MKVIDQTTRGGNLRSRPINHKATVNSELKELKAPKYRRDWSPHYQTRCTKQARTHETMMHERRAPPAAICIVCNKSALLSEKRMLTNRTCNLRAAASATHQVSADPVRKLRLYLKIECATEALKYSKDLQCQITRWQKNKST